MVSVPGRFAPTGCAQPGGPEGLGSVRTRWNSDKSILNLLPCVFWFYVVLFLPNIESIYVDTKFFFGFALLRRRRRSRRRRKRRRRNAVWG